MRRHDVGDDAERAYRIFYNLTCNNATLFVAMANRWAPLATVTDDPKPQRPSKKQPAAAQNGASDGSGVPPASINRAAAAAFPSPLPGASKSSDFPALTSNPAPAAQTQPHSSGVATQAYAAAASQRAPVTPAGAAVPAEAQHPVSQPKASSSKADWGYLSSERQKDKASHASLKPIIGSKMI